MDMPLFGWLAHAASARRAVYRLLASVFLFPSPERAALWPSAAALVLEVTRPLEGLAFYQSLRHALELLSEAGRSDPRSLERDYSRLFIGAGPPQVIPLRETGWVDVASRLSLPEVLSSLEGLYRQEGVDTSSRAYASDHLSVQLEFMAYLCEREAGAWTAGDSGEARRVLQAQRRLLKDHLMQWVPSVERALDQRDRDGVYLASIKAVHSLVAHDAGMADALLESMRERRWERPSA